MRCSKPRLKQEELLSGGSKTTCYSSAMVWISFMLLHSGYFQSENLSCKLGDSVFLYSFEKISTMPSGYMSTRWQFHISRYKQCGVPAIYNLRERQTASFSWNHTVPESSVILSFWVCLHL